MNSFFDDKKKSDKSEKKHKTQKPNLESEGQLVIPAEGLNDQKAAQNMQEQKNQNWERPDVDTQGYQIVRIVDEDKDEDNERYIQGSSTPKTPRTDIPHQERLIPVNRSIFTPERQEELINKLRIIAREHRDQETTNHLPENIKDLFQTILDYDQNFDQEDEQKPAPKK